MENVDVSVTKMTNECRKDSHDDCSWQVMLCKCLCHEDMVNCQLENGMMGWSNEIAKNNP